MGWLNINGNWIGRHSGKSWQTYWTHQPEVLFFGLYSEISGGQMPNKVDGGATYLTVAGSAGSETYQCPNTAPYQTADTDYIWFNTDAAQRTTTTAELIGYDFTRTIVKYANTAPYAIEAIMILNTDVDTAKMRDDFDLSVWWDNTLSAHGNVKGNRSSQQSVWTPGNEAEVDEYITGLATELSTGQVTALNSFVSAIKLGMGITNLYDAFDCIYVLAGETSESSLRNLVKNDYHCTSAALPTFVAFEGFTGNGSSQYINTNFNPTTPGSKFALNNNSFGVYLRTNNNGNYCAIGHSNTPAGVNRRRTYLYPRLSDIFYYTNNVGDANQDVANTDSRGIFISSRTASNLTTAYRNKIKVDSDTTPSIGLYDNNIYIGARLTNIGIDSYSIDQIAFAFIGRALSEDDVILLTNAFENYMDNNSKGVIA